MIPYPDRTGAGSRSILDSAGAVGGREHEALGRSRGGFSTRIHVRAEGRGRPMLFVLSSGERNEVPSSGPCSKAVPCPGWDEIVLGSIQPGSLVTWGTPIRLSVAVAASRGSERSSSRGVIRGSHTCPTLRHNRRVAVFPVMKGCASSSRAFTTLLSGRHGDCGRAPLHPQPWEAHWSTRRIPHS